MDKKDICSLLCRLNVIFLIKFKLINCVEAVKLVSQQHMVLNEQSGVETLAWSLFLITCQIVELLGSEGGRQGPAGPLDPQVGGGTFDQSAPHDRVLQLGQQRDNLRVCHRAAPPPTPGEIKTLWLKFKAAILQRGRGLTRGALWVV